MVDKKASMGGGGRTHPTNRHTNQGPINATRPEGVEKGERQPPNPPATQGPFEDESWEGKPNRICMHIVPRIHNNGMLPGTPCSMYTLQPYGFSAILLMHAIVATHVHTISKPPCGLRFPYDGHVTGKL